ncbi:MAG: DNA-binding protein [Acidobacteria bacterium]|nr:MAG: DNA-binding protein [Acidobacteriota bacterium]
MELTIPAAAKRLGRDPETVRRWVRSGRLRARKLGTQYFIDPADLPEASGTVPLPDWLRKTVTGEPMPDVVAELRRQRSEH